MNKKCVKIHVHMHETETTKWRFFDTTPKKRPSLVGKISKYTKGFISCPWPHPLKNEIWSLDHLCTESRTDLCKWQMLDPYKYQHVSVRWRGGREMQLDLTGYHLAAQNAKMINNCVIGKKGTTTINLWLGKHELQCLYSHKSIPVYSHCHWQ